MTPEELKTSEGWCRFTGEKALASQVQTYSQTRPSEDPWTRLYLAEGQAILAAAMATLGGRHKAIDWFCHAKLAPFGDLTPRVLLSLGRSEDVLHALRVIQVGSYQAALQSSPRRSVRPVCWRRPKIDPPVRVVPVQI
ncbi:hypothetical protein WKW79_34280 [Variovorax robiniae]|uniref:Antitoxin Xre/MbcA/ParS-like toxin-binding domain-containing protein n=1 Tax=Variovorax robiniae TaxID=1836199 RepID=A0ABU8XJK8_9BURK